MNYVVAENADVPPIDVHFLDYPDKELNELGAHGVGETGQPALRRRLPMRVHHAP